MESFREAETEMLRLFVTIIWLFLSVRKLIFKFMWKMILAAFSFLFLLPCLRTLRCRRDKRAGKCGQIWLFYEGDACILERNLGVNVVDPVEFMYLRREWFSKEIFFKSSRKMIPQQLTTVESNIFQLRLFGARDHYRKANSLTTNDLSRNVWSYEICSTWSHHGKHIYCHGKYLRVTS